MNDDVINFETYFMAMAIISSMRSKDGRTQVGACIANSQNRVVSTGYNGMPNNIPDAEMPWGLDPDDFMNAKYTYVCHAELNSILNAHSNLEGCTLYTTLFPCNECTKAIIQSGIKKVVYLSDKYKEMDPFKASRSLLEKADIKIEKFNPKVPKITLNLDVKD